MLTGLSFSNPWAGWLLLLVPLVSALLLLELRRKQSFLRTLGEVSLLSRFSGLGPEWPARLRPLFLTLGFLGIVAAVVGPVLATKPAHDDPRPADIVLVIDVSRSMAALDYSPGISRLGKAKEMIREALPDLSKSRVGVVTFAGGPFRQAPLTRDHGALTYILTNWVTIESAPPGGSDMAEGIRMAARLFQGRQGERLLLLFSDGGESRPESLRSAAAEARSNGIRILAFGLGGPAASRIPRYDGDGRFSGWLTLNGEVATTRLNEAVMNEIASGTAGGYSRVMSGKEVRQTLDRLKVAGGRSSGESRALFQWPLAAALLLLFAELAAARLRGWRLGAASREATPMPPNAGRAVANAR